jgi:hypothetical protein
MGIAKAGQEQIPAAVYLPLKQGLPGRGFADKGNFIAVDPKLTRSGRHCVKVGYKGII